MVRYTLEDMRKPTYIIGIDEAGRGPLAGPVAVGVALVPANFDWALLPGVGDSKSVSERRREHIYTAKEALPKKVGVVTYVAMKSAHDIDTRGIAVVIREAIVEGLEHVLRASKVRTEECLVLLDGGLRAPEQFSQKTIIRGDATELAIGLASIMAKVTRDRYMVALSTQTAYQAYRFEKHKGYGTKEHRATIADFGVSDEHRVSFCRNIAIKPG